MTQAESTLLRQQKQSWFKKPGTGHLLQLYRSQLDIVPHLFEYVSIGLARHETCVVIATPETLIALQKSLRSAHIDLAEAISLGEYVAYDAEELLAKLIDAQGLDALCLDRYVGTVINRSLRQAKRVRIFGELVAVLLRQQNVRGALLVEQGWDALTHRYPCSLYCAYPEKGTLDGFSIQAMEQVAARHTLSMYA